MGWPSRAMTLPRSTATRLESIVPWATPVCIGVLPVYRNWVEVRTSEATLLFSGGATLLGSGGSTSVGPRVAVGVPVGLAVAVTLGVLLAVGLGVAVSVGNAVP